VDSLVRFRYAFLAVLLTLLIPAPPLLRCQTYAIPDWARGCVWYRIIPDRFRNADTANDPVERDVFPEGNFRWAKSDWTANWYRRSITELLYSESFAITAPLRQYGGDFDGIISRIPYLDSLGINAVVLTPPFEGTSYHKFDITSYHHVDRHFGPQVQVDTAFLSREKADDPKTWYLTAADRKFVELIKALHDHGIRVMVDVQFAHVGANFWAFRDLLQKQEKSTYANWFYVEDWDRPETPLVSEFRYRSMWGITAFPVLRRDSLGLATGPRDYIFSSTRRWMDPNGDGNPSDGIDGWRVDLTSEISPVFWKDWMKHVLSINPQCLVIGAPAGENVPTPFHMEDNDVFGRHVSLFFLNERISPTQLDNAVVSLHGEGDYTVTDAHVNRIGDYETARVASMCVNRAVPYGAKDSWQANPSYVLRRPAAADRRLQQLLLLFQFTCPGSPLLYYGDEAGMWGANDPDCRKPMLWPDLEYEKECSLQVSGDSAVSPVAFDSSVYGMYRTFLRLRKDHIALRQGAMKTVLLDDVRMLYGYERHSGADRVYVLFNMSNTPQECRVFMKDVPSGARVDAVLEGLQFFTEKDGLSIILPPRSGTLLLPAL
jgi:cyclomaltodextrinase / maltogenic alpha-amylase / neopullulanase